MRGVTWNRFPCDWLLCHMWSEVVWIQICASLNHRKNMKAEPCWLIPRKSTENLELLIVAERCVPFKTVCVYSAFHEPPECVPGVALNIPVRWISFTAILTAGRAEQSNRIASPMLEANASLLHMFAQRACVDNSNIHWAYRLHSARRSPPASPVARNDRSTFVFFCYLECACLFGGERQLHQGLNWMMQNHINFTFVDEIPELNIFRTLQ